jgi:hypothetical protein
MSRRSRHGDILARLHAQRVKLEGAFPSIISDIDAISSMISDIDAWEQVKADEHARAHTTATLRDITKAASEDGRVLPSGAWDCNVCARNNAATHLRCSNCDTPHPTALGAFYRLRAIDED